MSRRLRSRALLVLLAAVALPTAPPCRATEAPLPLAQFRGGNGAFGRFDGKVPLRRPRALWTFRTDAPISSTPLWAGDTVYVGGGDRSFYALDSRTGAVRWKAETGGAADGSPVWADGLVVAASRDRTLRAFAPATGVERWRFAFGEDVPFTGRAQGWDFFLSTPAVVDGALYVGGGDGHVYRIDARTGREAWRFRTAGRVRSSPAVVDGVVYVGSFDGHLYALEAKTGALRWRFATQGVSIDSEKAGFDRRSVQSSPAVSGDVVVVGARDGFLYGVDRATGKERWRLDHQVSWVVGSPSVKDGVAYVGSSDGRFFQAVDVATGKERWRRPTPMNVFSSAALAGEVVLFGCHSGDLFALDSGTGRELWRHRTGETIHASPVVRDGVVLVGSLDGTLTALGGDLEAGASAARRAVYADATLPGLFVKGAAALRERLAREGYEALDAGDLVEFLKARVADRTPSVVVFAGDQVPVEVDAEAEGGALVRRYLEAGGKAVWLGAPPFAMTFDPATKRVTGFDLARTEKVLGVSEGYLRGAYQLRFSPAAERWGLRGWWVGEVGAPAARVDPLSEPVNGLAGAWVKRFGGGEGTGFVRLGMRVASAVDPEWVLKAAEHGLP